MNSWTELSEEEYEQFDDAESNGELVKYISDFLGAGGNPDSYILNTGSLLSEVSFFQNIDSMRILLKNGADVDGKCPKGSCESPITAGLRANERSREVLELLLSYNADVNCDEGRLGSPLDVVLWNGDEECLRILLEAGADPKYGGVDGDKLPNIRVPDTVAEEQEKRIVELFAEFGHELPEIRK